MKKRNILISLIVVLIIVVIVSIIIFNNNNINNEVNIENEQENIQIAEEGNVFLATVISNEHNKIIVVPNKDELIYQSFKILNVQVNQNTKILKKDGSVVTIDNIEKNKIVKIQFDGKILSTNPTNIIATSLEVQ